jgi:hypothetical protein
MVTLEIARAAGNAFGRINFHYGECVRTTGPRGGITESVEKWRVNGALKTWVTRPGEFSLPIKYGMGYGRGQHGYITHENARHWHVADDCPLNAARVPMTVAA